MNSMETISLVIVILTLLKLLVFIFNPKWLSKMMDLVLKKNMLMTISVIIGGAVVAYFVFLNLSITQALPAILLGHFILALVMMQYPNVYKTLAKDVLKDRKKSWFIWLIWIVLSLWTLFVLFF